MLEIKNVVIERGGRTLFAPLTLSAGSGTLVRIGGANGAGKTTLLRALAGLTSIASGEVSWLSPSSHNNIGRVSIFIGHSNAMNDALTAQENWAYSEGAAGYSSTHEEVRTALEKMGVASLIDRRIGTLSQGQKKRVALSRLFAPSNAKAAWLLDEPFGALDAATQALLAQHVSDALARGTLVVLTSHQAVDIAANNVLDIALTAQQRGAA
ncbi:MAG: heme ABC exporter ATP-binding protein CcmA [Casimicrobium sp.]